jgi:hypothetical protein
LKRLLLKLLLRWKLHLLKLHLLKLLLRWKLHLLTLLHLLLMPLHLLLTLLLPLPINSGLRKKKPAFGPVFLSVRRAKISASAESPTHIAMPQSIRQRNGSNIRSTFLFGGHSHLA